MKTIDKSLKKENIEAIKTSILNGQMKQAKTQTMYLVKTKPMALAHRVGQVVGALMEGNETDKNNAVKFLKLFENKD